MFNLNWAYNLGVPEGTARLKATASDFVVTEDLGYAPSGQGEHLFFWVEKQGLNTAYVAEALAKYTGLPLRQVTYAGRKDKYAITRQWFGLHAPKGLNVDINAMQLPGFTVLSSHRHHKKLKVGQLQGNHFSITLRNISAPDSILQRLTNIQQCGVPNYFGDQRFGIMQRSDGTHAVGGTLDLGLRMLDGESIRNRNKRNMAISALRSAVFNTVISARIESGFFDEVRRGDACALTGSNSYFIERGDTLEASQARYQEHDISPTAPLLGSAKTSLCAESLAWETHILAPYAKVVEILTEQGLSAARRAIKLWPKALEWQLHDDKLHIQFGLPAGCFATSVLRECVQFQPATDSGND